MAFYCVESGATLWVSISALKVVELPRFGGSDDNPSCR